MNQVLEFNRETAKGRFSLNQMTFGEHITNDEKTAFPYCVLGVDKNTEDENFQISLYHACALPTNYDEDDDEADSKLGTFGRDLSLKDLPTINISATDLMLGQTQSTIQSVVEGLIQSTIYQFGRLHVISYLGALHVELSCFGFTGSLQIFHTMKHSDMTSKNLAGGIITTSFIVDGSAKRTLADL